MNSLFSKSTFALINLAALAVCCSTMSAKAETGNLPDVATTTTIAAQNIDQISEPTATSAVKPDAETTASNKKIDSISWSELACKLAEPVASEPAANLPVSDWLHPKNRKQQHLKLLRQKQRKIPPLLLRPKSRKKPLKLLIIASTCSQLSRLPKRAIDLPQLLPRAIILN